MVFAGFYIFFIKSRKISDQACDIPSQIWTDFEKFNQQVITIELQRYFVIWKNLMFSVYTSTDF